MAKKAKVKRCVECPHCVDIGLSEYQQDYVCSYDNLREKLENVLIIPDWCMLEEWE